MPEAQASVALHVLKANEPICWPGIITRMDHVRDQVRYFPKWYPTR